MRIVQVIERASRERKRKKKQDQARKQKHKRAEEIQDNTASMRGEQFKGEKGIQDAFHCIAVAH